MSFKRPPTEDKFVNDYLQKQVQALGVNLSLQEKFVHFAVNQAGADPRKFPPRLYHVIKGRTPSAFIAILIVKFFSEHWHEDFKRITINHVEYLTSSGDTVALERFVASHPLSLRIIQVQAIDWVVSGKPQRIQVQLRTPVTYDSPPEGTQDDEDQWFQTKWAEFASWLSAQGEIPQKLKLSGDEEFEVSYLPDWMSSHGSNDYLHDSDLSGDVDVGHGIRLLRYCEYGDKSPDVPEGLDTCFELHQLLVGTDVKPAPMELTFANYWPRIVAEQSDIAEIYFTHIERFPETVRRHLDPCFANFAKRHRRWLAKANTDSKVRDEQGDDFVPTPADVEHYDHVVRAFFEDLKPALESCWPEFATAMKEIHATERVRAGEHFAKMKKLLNLE